MSDTKWLAWMRRTETASPFLQDLRYEVDGYARGQGWIRTPWLDKPEPTDAEAPIELDPAKYTKWEDIKKCKHKTVAWIGRHGEQCQDCGQWMDEEGEADENDDTQTERSGMTNEQARALQHGLYRLFWVSGGSSLAAVGSTTRGDRWMAPTNWVDGVASGRDGDGRPLWSHVRHAEKVKVGSPRSTFIDGGLWAIERIESLGTDLANECTAHAKLKDEVRELLIALGGYKTIASALKAARK